MFLLVLVVIAAVGAAVATPLLRPRGERSRDTGSERALLEARKEAKYREIRDAEADFRTGKLSEPDYRALDRSLRREAIEILTEMDELDDRDRRSS